MDGYTEGLERLMRRLFGSLKESDRRRYAAIEAAKLGHGGTDSLFQNWDSDVGRG
jgi:hypothetical protein